MEKWILAADLLERGKPSAVNLISAVKCGELKAYDTNSDNPIDWKEIEEQFEEIKNICEEKYFEEGPLRRYSSVDRERKLVLLKARVSVFNDYYPMPWNVLYNYLKSGRPAEIPETQYFEILEGWGNNQITYFVKTAKFKEEDVERVFPEKEATPPATNQAQPQNCNSQELRNPTGSRMLTGRKEIADYFGYTWPTVQNYAKKGKWLFYNDTNKPTTSTYEIDEFRKLSSSKKKK